MEKDRRGGSKEGRSAIDDLLFTFPRELEGLQNYDLRAFKGVGGVNPEWY